MGIYIVMCHILSHFLYQCTMELFPNMSYNLPFCNLFPRWVGLSWCFSTFGSDCMRPSDSDFCTQWLFISSVFAFIPSPCSVHERTNSYFNFTLTEKDNTSECFREKTSRWYLRNFLSVYKHLSIKADQRFVPLLPFTKMVNEGQVKTIYLSTCMHLYYIIWHTC